MTEKPDEDAEVEALAEEFLQELAVDHVDDLDALIAWLQAAKDDPKALSNLIRYRHAPVGPQEFVESDEFMKAKGVLWPEVMKEFVEINSGRYTETVLTGAIGVAKTTIALYTQAYQLYLLSCLRNPHAEFDLDPASEIEIIFQSINKDLAKDVDYARFQAMIQRSPYFERHFPYDKNKESQLVFPRRIIVKPISGSDKAAIGQNVIGGVIDEVNFMAVIEKSKQSRDAGTYDQAVSNYNTIAKRRESRFMDQGFVAGMLCLVSSRNYPGQFTDQKEKEARTNPLIYVYDKKLWELRPERFSGEMFSLFVGDETRKPRFLGEGDMVSAEDRMQGLVMNIPVEYRRSFENDMYGALRDIAGVATVAQHPFILDRDALAEAFGKVKSIVTPGLVDLDALKPGFIADNFKHRQRPRFVHLDLALTGDRAGIACGHVHGFKSVDRGDQVELLPIITIDFILGVNPPKGGEIKLSLIRALLYKLVELGVPIRWITMDSFQSADTIQLLRQRGFSAGIQSVDIDSTPYDVTKSAISDGRLEMPEHATAMAEFSGLELDVKTRKIDHRPNGSKDCTDAIAGVCYGLSIQRETYFHHEVPLSAVPGYLQAQQQNAEKEQAA